jgi:eukaryotic-like serine/threonine-protein kinase
VPQTDQLNVALAGRYVIERELGQGGMATVYLAHDVRHDRKVALKVLRPELAAVIGADRFLQEIKVTANLQHPHILPLFDSGHAEVPHERGAGGEALYYVMPYVEGESLRDLIQREKQLPIEQAVRIASEVADALDYAHRHAVVHRDIKPENILLHDGRVAVSDFGIALAVSTAGGTRMTETGLSLGTPHYMSPEQAMGDRDVDARSDVYALGATLYEMLAGEPPFTGPTAQAIVAKLVTSTPEPVTTYRKTTPPHVVDAVHQALQKLPADRFPTAAAFRDALLDQGATRSATASVTGVPRRGRWTPPSWAGWGLAAALAVAAGAAWLRPAPEVPRDPVRFTLDVQGRAGVRMRGAGGLMSDIVISPDGRTIVYVGSGDPETQLYRRRLDRLAWEPIPGTNDADSPFFSADGRWLGFRQGSRLRKVDLASGAIVTLATLDRSSLITGAAWSETDTIYVALEALGGLFRLPADGGVLERMPVSDSLSLFWGITLLPGHTWALVSLSPPGQGIVSIVAAVSLGTGEVRHLVDGGQGSQFLPGGRMVFFLPDGTPVTAPLDPADPQPTTERTPAVEAIAQTAGDTPHLSVAGNGTAVFLQGGSAENTVVFVDRTGREAPILSQPRDYKDPRFSPDGRRLAYEVAEGNEGDIWIYEFERATAARLTFGSENLYPVWSPDGRHVAFTSRRTGIAGLWWKAADGSGDAEELMGGTELRFPGTFTPDGRTVLYRETAPTTGFDIYALPLDGERTPRPVVVTPFNESSPMLSPDGRWLAFVSDQSGRNEVYARAYPDGASDFQISAGGGTEPVWHPDGRRLYYRRGGTLLQATLGLSDRAAVVRRDSLFSGPYLENIRWPEYHVHPDGDRFVFVKLGRMALVPVVVLNWAQDLARQAAGREGS